MMRPLVCCFVISTDSNRDYITATLSSEAASVCQVKIEAMQKLIMKRNRHIPFIKGATVYDIHLIGFDSVTSQRTSECAWFYLIV